MDSELKKLLEEAVKRPATAEELRQQRRSYVASEMAWGSDADEAAYRAALERGDKEKIAQLEAEAEERKQRALRRFDRYKG